MSLQGQIYWKNIHMYVYVYLFLWCSTNHYQRLYFNTGALLGAWIFLQALVLHFDHWPWKNVFKWRKIDVLPICCKWICACCSIQGLGELLPVPWMWFRASRGMIRALFSVLLAGLVVEATSLTILSTFPWQCVYTNQSGEKYFCFYFPEFPEWEEQYLPSLPLRNGSRKIMTEKDLHLRLLYPCPEH